MARHPSLTTDLLLDAVERRMHTLDNPGFCRLCGAEADTCEPDAEGYECEACGAETSVSSPEIMLRLI